MHTAYVCNMASCIHFTLPPSRTGLEPLLDFDIFGRVAVVDAVRVSERDSTATDMLFVCTERRQFCMLWFDQESNRIVTKVAGDLSHESARDAEQGFLHVLGGDFLAVHSYDCLLQVLPLDDRGDFTENAYQV
jgi:hypothetical protein